MTTAPKPRALTERRCRFVAAYLAEPNAAAAARVAGYSPRRAKQTGSDLLRDPLVLATLAACQEAVDHRRVLAEEAQLAFADPRACFGPDGEPLPPNLLPEDIARAVASVECKETGARDGGLTRTWKYAFWSKEKALERLSKHLGASGRETEGPGQAVVNFVMDLGETAALEPGPESGPDAAPDGKEKPRA